MSTRTNPSEISLRAKYCLRREYKSLKGIGRVILCSRDAVWFLPFQKDLILHHCHKEKKKMVIMVLCKQCSLGGSPSTWMKILSYPDIAMS